MTYPYLIFQWKARQGIIIKIKLATIRRNCEEFDPVPYLIWGGSFQRI